MNAKYTRKEKRYQDLSFTDDFMFSHVLSNNPELCKELTEAILELKVKEIVHISKQPEIRPTRDGKGVRFDVYFEDDESVYDIEMQTSNQDNLRLRSRYYQSMIDRKILRRGSKYQELRKSYVIFICTFDLFSKGLGKYTFKNICSEDNTLELDDGSIKVFVNASGDSSGLSDGLRDLMRFVTTGEPQGALSQKLFDEVEIAKMNPELEETYMTFEEKLEERYEAGLIDGRAEGRVEGHTAGHSEGIIDSIRIMLKKITPEEIEELGFSPDDIRRARNES